MINDGSLSEFLRRGISRRNLVHRTAGSAGAVLASGLWAPARADDGNERSCAVPLPIPHTTAGPFGPFHAYLPGPIDGSAAPTDGTGTHSEGRDPSSITNFSGFVGEVDLTFNGTARDTKTNAKSSYTFHTDTRFMKGNFIGSDQMLHEGAFAFI